MAQARAGLGTQLKRGDGASPEVFTTVAAVKDPTLGALTRKTLDTTTHDAANGYNTFITGMADGGEVNFKLLFAADETTHKDSSGGLLYDFNNPSVRNYQIVPAGYSPSVKWTFAAVITKLGPFSYPVDGIQESDCTLKISGKPVLA